MNYVLDTNIVSLIIREHPVVVRQFQATLRPGNRILGCPVVWYEVRRGLIARDARQQMGKFERIFAAFDWDDYTRADWQLAADLWAQRRAGGRPIANADLLIAVFARNRAAVIVTDNARDFDGLGLALENWLPAP